MDDVGIVDIVVLVVVYCGVDIAKVVVGVVEGVVPTDGGERASPALALALKKAKT